MRRRGHQKQEDRDAAVIKIERLRLKLQSGGLRRDAYKKARQRNSNEVAKEKRETGRSAAQTCVEAIDRVERIDAVVGQTGG